MVKINKMKVRHLVEFLKAFDQDLYVKIMDEVSPGVWEPVDVTSIRVRTFSADPTNFVEIA